MLRRLPLGRAVSVLAVAGAFAAGALMPTEVPWMPPLSDVQVQQAPSATPETPEAPSDVLEARQAYAELYTDGCEQDFVATYAGLQAGTPEGDYLVVVPSDAHPGYSHVFDDADAEGC